MEILHEEKIKFLEETANQLRCDVINMLVEAGSGHPAGALSMADVFSAFYFHILNHDPQNPNWLDRDRLVLSNGHICPIQYAALARSGYFPIEELKTLRKINSRLQGHPFRKALPGIETSSGPLGEGLSQAIGIALAARLDNKKYRTYCIMSDGEQDCGSVWEAAMLAGKYRLSNLTAIIDRNNIQSDGFTEEIMPLEPLRDKYESFNWHVLEVDGHNIEEFVDAVNEARAIFEKPTVIIAYTTPGKGVDFMEFDFRWHATVPDKQQAKKALEELKTLGGKIEAE
ncbi:transketolase [Candidatus Roizmanbacteria bacterium CG10_big_fil_rev_8_21_14_0_10_36_26]|uniref:Transketolase n=1 Tax=Candidatus Roizmanbacteria bacterium CG10_big_fil_rev_8_21_14_0_10_36_26 TaxID=1974851 RepID=A0A2M8KLX8_9BACT|nr:MAG: transketolase [Candidatus Roizmanbacteria bacterium CG10_big_fil_rev_8_21_14_0_10_36_26]